MIEARGLSKSYGSTLAVDDLSFTVPAGEVTGFLGPNGSGKSTTMRMVLGLDRPSEGAVTVGGRRYGLYRRPLLEVGALLDATAVHGGRRAEDHLRWLALSNGIDPGRVGRVLGQVGLDGVARRRVGGFSLGMKQRLGIAAALLGDPRVLILDEPINGLDPDGVIWVRDLLRALAAEGRTVFLSSHLMSEMALVADRLVILGHGRLVAEATMSDLLDAGGEVDVRSPQAETLAGRLEDAGATVEREPDGNLRVSGMTADGIGELARAHDLTLSGLSTHQRTLEEGYMELTRGFLDHETGRVS